MRHSPFSTHRGAIVRRVIIGVCAVAVGLFFLTRITNGQGTEVEARPGDRNLFGNARAPAVEPPVADPFAPGRAAGTAPGRAGVNPSERIRADAAVATATRFAVAYATFNADGTPENHVAALPYVSSGLRTNLLREAKERWPGVRRDRTVAVARASSIPAELAAYARTAAQARVQVLQDVSAVSGQRTNTLTYRVDLEWDPNAAASPDLLPTLSSSAGASGRGASGLAGEGRAAPDPSAQPAPGPSAPTGAWLVTGVLPL